MPLIEDKFKISNGHLLVWRLQESAELLRDILPTWLDLTEYQKINHPQKKREWLAGRHLFAALCDLAGIPFQGIWKSPDGKPFLLGSKAHISLSHSEHYVAAALHFDSPIGVDLEQARPQLSRIAHKFLSDEEFGKTNGDLNLLCKYWGAKEAVYKLVGEKKISFRDHIRVISSPDTAQWSAIVETPDISERALIRFEKISDYSLAIALQSSDI